MAKMLRKEYLKRWRDHYGFHATVVKMKADALHSDGCSGVPDFYIVSCYEHDIAYRTGIGYIDNQPISRKEADIRMKWHVQLCSPFGRFSPMAQWRYWWIRWFSRKHWQGGEDVAY